MASIYDDVCTAVLYINYYLNLSYPARWHNMAIYDYYRLQPAIYILWQLYNVPYK